MKHQSHSYHALPPPLPRVKKRILALVSAKWQSKWLEYATKYWHFPSGGEQQHTILISPALLIDFVNGGVEAHVPRGILTYVCTYMCTCGSQRLSSGSYSTAPPHYILSRFSCWIWSSLIQLDWLDNELQQAVSSTPIAEVTDMHHLPIDFESCGCSWSQHGCEGEEESGTQPQLLLSWTSDECPDNHVQKETCD